MSASPEHAAPEGRRRIIAEVDAGVAHSLRVFAAEHDSTISGVLRDLVDNLLHPDLPCEVGQRVSTPDPPVVKGPSHLLCLKEVAGHFQVSPETVRRWVRRRLIAAVRAGNRTYRFDPAEVSRFQRKRATGGCP